MHGLQGRNDCQMRRPDEGPPLYLHATGPHHTGNQPDSGTDNTRRVAQCAPSATPLSTPTILASATVVLQSDMAFQWSQTAATMATCHSWCDAPMFHDPGAQHSGNCVCAERSEKEERGSGEDHEPGWRRTRDRRGRRRRRGWLDLQVTFHRVCEHMCKVLDRSRSESAL